MLFNALLSFEFTYKFFVDSNTSVSHASFSSFNDFFIYYLYWYMNMLTNLVIPDGNRD